MNLDLNGDENTLRTSTNHSNLAHAIRFLAIDAVEAAKSGHPGMPMGMADVATVLFSDFLKFDPSMPLWADRDRFILSAGHGSMLLYALLYLTGYKEITEKELRNFRQLGAKTAGHPEYHPKSGIETTTGPLGQGLANAVGMAIAERHLANRFGSQLINHYTYCIAGDGCLMEGISHEAASLAGHQALSKLIILFDDNGISIDGPTRLSVSDNHLKRFQSYGWHTMAIDGHDPNSISIALTEARASQKPTLIAAKTTIGFGAPNKEGTSGAHGAPLGTKEVELVRENLEWPHDPFLIPKNILQSWRKIGSRGSKESGDWLKRLENSDFQIRKSFKAAINGDALDTLKDAINQHKKSLVKNPPTIATRVASQMTLEAITPHIPELIGGSSDLTGSNNTKTAYHTILDKEHPSGNYIHYGVREHAMAAAMNGMALHGGITPYGATFLVFTDYCRPAIRLAALMEIQTIYVMTHDSIGLGEDGPTHQPVEHLAALRAIPNLNVYRPADAIETAECWQIALETRSTPSIIVLTRQGLPQLRKRHNRENLSANGGYILKNTDRKNHVLTLVATGSEVSLALEAQTLLDNDGIGAVVVSIPCFEIFKNQNQKYRDNVISPSKPAIVIEAGIRQNWDSILNTNDKFIGMESFGASAPGPVLYEHFGITTEKIVAAAKSIFTSK